MLSILFIIATLCWIALGLFMILSPHDYQSVAHGGMLILITLGLNSLSPIVVLALHRQGQTL